MYKIEEAYQDTKAHPHEEIWNGKIACIKGNAQNAMTVNNMKDTLEAYSVALILQGEVLVESNDKEVILVSSGAVERIAEVRRHRFFHEQLPEMVRTMHALDIPFGDVTNEMNKLMINI